MHRKAPFIGSHVSVDLDADGLLLRVSLEGVDGALPSAPGILLSTERHVQTPDIVFSRVNTWNSIINSIDSGQ